jgi:hypothetical protein
MELGLTTPALLFPAISLLLLAYTNRFLTLANLIRDLHARYRANPDQILLWQLRSLRYRVLLIKHMQGFGVASFLLCVVSMFALFVDWEVAGKVIFGVALVLMVVSLTLSLREIQVSVDALNMRLSDIEELAEQAAPRTAAKPPLGPVS